jgi:hypothetical protein
VSVEMFYHITLSACACACACACLCVSVYVWVGGNRNVIRLMEPPLFGFPFLKILFIFPYLILINKQPSKFKVVSYIKRQMIL